jgi:hypothetical protein
MMGGGRSERHVLRTVGIVALIFAPRHFLGISGQVGTSQTG